jgi:hypothetical protein
MATTSAYAVAVKELIIGAGIVEVAIAPIEKGLI